MATKLQKGKAYSSNKAAPKKITWSGQKCDFCKADAMYDAPMLGSGSWAYYCIQHKYMAGKAGLLTGYEFVKQKECKNNDLE